MDNFLVIGPTPSGSMGGIQRFTHEFCQSLSRYGRVIYLSHWLEKEKKRVDRIYQEYGPWSAWGIFNRELFRKYLLVLKPKFIFAAAHYVTDVIPDLHLKNETVLSIFTHGIEVWGNISPEDRRILNKAEIIIANSRFTADYIKNQIGVKSPIYILNPCVDTNHFKPVGNDILDTIRKRYKLSGECLFLLTVGGLNKGRNKGHRNVINIMPKLLDRFTRLEYIVVGNGDDLPNIKSMTREMGLEEKVRFIGPVPDADLPGIYSLCDIFIMVSDFRIGKNPEGEGFGIVYLEAASCAKPVIGGIGGGTDDAIAHGYNGYLVNPRDEEQLYNVICGVLSYNNMLEIMGQNGRLRAVNQFSRNTFHENVHTLIDNIKNKLEN